MKINIPDTIVDTIKQSDIRSLIIDNSEVAFDALLDDGILKDIPVIGNLFKVYSVSQSITNNLFTKKLLKFLNELEELPKEDRIRFVKKLDEKPTFKKKVGEKIMLLLERFDDIRKSEFLAITLKLHIKGIIDFKQFQVLSFIIEQFNMAYINDLSLSFKYQISNIPTEIYDHFLNCGIFKSKGKQEDRIIESNPMLFKSDMGKLLTQHIINLNVEELKNYYIEYILDIDITDSIGDYVKDVNTLISRDEAREFLNGLSDEHFDGSLIGGKQFLDKERKTRFRRTGKHIYEFFYA